VWSTSPIKRRVFFVPFDNQPQLDNLEQAIATRASTMVGESPSQPPPKGGMASLYANLLDPGSSDSTSISRAPVVFKQSSPEEGRQEAVKKQQSNTGRYH
jgi:hypothetical protein